MYKIISIELYRFTGFWLNNVTNFKWDITSNISLILGRNGSGKSRLIRIASVLCPEKKDFPDKGWSKITVMTDKATYLIHCVRTKSGFKCSIKDLTNDAVISDNTNPTVHHQLTKEMFNYTRELHDIITGKVKLTDMGRNERKRWFSLLSDSDLTYPLEFHKQARIQYRNIQGAITTAKQVVGKLRPQVIDDEVEYTATSDRIRMLQTDIGTIDREIEDSKVTGTLGESHLNDNTQHITRINREIMSINVNVSDLADNRSVGELELDLVRHTTELEGLVERQSEIDGKLERASKVKQIDAAKLQLMSDELNDEMAVLEAKIPEHYKLLSDFDELTLTQANAQLIEFRPTLIDILTELDTDIPVDNLEQRYNDTLKRLDAVVATKNELENDQVRTVHSISIINDTHDVTCPQCTTEFKPGVTAGDLESLTALTIELSEKILVLNNHITDLQELAERYDGLRKYMRMLNDMLRYFITNAATSHFFKLLQGKDAFKVNQRTFIPLIHEYETVLSTAVVYTGKLAKRDRIDTDLVIIRAAQTDDVEDLQQLSESLNLRVMRTTALRNTLVQNIGHVKSYLDKIERLKHLETSLSDAINDRVNIETNIINQIRIEILTEHRKELWDTVIVAKQRFEDMDRAKMRLSIQLADITTNQSRLDSLSRIVDAMSPEGGILAKYLYQCITKVTDLMTTYIDAMWGYKMKILPCDVTDSELDYKFPFWAGDKSKCGADVSEGSTAQQEVFNFVFVLAVYRAMNLNNYPLFLDELGSGFDEYHKSEMVKFVKSMVERGMNSQIYMVSHDALTHFQLTHAAAIVLDSNGVTLPDTYNETVEIS